MNEWYICPGAQKAGTTSLYNILKDHPEINLTKDKESRFFYKNDLFDKGINFYKSHFFAPVKEGRPFLEIDPDLLYLDYVPERIYRTLGGQVRFIIVLRDPVDRAYSGFLMEKHKKNEKLDVEEAFRNETERIKDPEGNFFFSYLHRGLYNVQLKRYLEYFPKENFRIFIFEEDFLKGRKKMISEICDFLGVSDVDPQALDVKSNRSRKVKSKMIDKLIWQGARTSGPVMDILRKILPAGIRKPLGRTYMNARLKLRHILHKANTTYSGIDILSPDLRQTLIREFFLEDIEQLEVLIDRDLSIWKE